MLDILYHMRHHEIRNGMAIWSMAIEQANYFGAALIDNKEIVLILRAFATLLAEVFNCVAV